MLSYFIIEFVLFVYITSLILQVGKKLSELIRDLGSQVSGNEPNRWQAELAHVAIELIAVSTLNVHPFSLKSQIFLYILFYFFGLMKLLYL